jgi:hypothetical protein
MSKLNPIFCSIDQLFTSCDNDYNELKNQVINIEWLSIYSNQRIVNSFLFNYIKIQDKIGAKLFRTLLLELKEIDDLSIPMIDIIHILEKLNILTDTDQWERLREIRNLIAHEYPSDISECIENIQLALKGYVILKTLFNNIKDYAASKNLS